MFLKNAWYVVAWSKNLGRELRSVRLFGERIVLYRQQDGQPAALSDRCPHRNLPLSAGKLLGDTIQCGYHGLEFDANGACVRAPGEPRIPDWCHVRAFPAAERHGWVFVFGGDPAKAQDTPVPTFHAELDDPQWGAATGELVVPCGYRLILDNLLDLSHLAYVHSSSTGNDDVANAAAVEVSSDNPEHVRQTRVMRGVTPAPAFVHYGGYQGPIDRWQMTDYFVPSYIRINNGSRHASPADTPIDAQHDLGDWGFRVFHALTPETPTTTRQFWAVPYRRDMVSEDEHALWQSQMDNVLREDHDVYAAQQAAIDDDAQSGGDVRPSGALRGDRGLYEMRRALKRALDA